MKTVFVLGAGASADLNYPWGKALKDRILTLLEPRNDGYKGLLAAGNAQTDVEDFIERLREADIDTIDQFIEELDALDHIRAVGRQALAIAISSHEGGILFNKSLDESCWFRLLLDYLRATKGQQISSEYFSFITFNYDLALEHYLYRTITAGSSREDMRAILSEKFLSPKNFIHLHGRIGFLEWMNAPKDVKPRTYGARIPNEDLRLIAKDLLLPHEGLDTAPIRNLLLTANTIVILGFGFHPHNLGRIFFDELANNSVPVFATTYRLESEKVEFLNKYQNIRQFPTPCKDFMRDFLVRLKADTLRDWRG